MKENVRKYLITGLCVLAILSLFLPFIGFDVKMELFGGSSGASEMSNGMTVIQESSLGFLLLIGPVFLAALPWIKPLAKWNKKLTIVIPIVCLISLVLTIFQMKSNGFDAYGEGIAVDMSVSIGIGAILAGISYIACAVLGVLMKGDIEMDKVGMEQLKSEGLSLLEKAQESVRGGTELVRLNSQLSAEEKTIEKTYLEIGKKYVELHAEEKEAAFAEFLHIIEQSQENIKNYRNQILILKGIRLCPNCGSEVPSGSAFCSSCGTPMPKDVADMIPCHSCGNMIPSNKKFCAYCGAKVVIPEPVVAEKPKCPNCGCEVEDDKPFCCECGASLSNLNSTEAKQAEPIVNKCTNCGCELEEGTVFCMECGAKL